MLIFNKKKFGNANAVSEMEIHGVDWPRTALCRLGSLRKFALFSGAADRAAVL